MLRKIIIALIVLLILITWVIYMITNNSWHLFYENWFMSLTMVFGSFIAGASSEGGGAIAFPVMTLMFDIPPQIARNFSLAIQSVGMGMASVLIVAKKIKVEYRYILLISIGGVFGFLTGTYYLCPWVLPPYAKILFVSFWLSFGIILFYYNEINKRKVVEALPPFNSAEIITIILIGFVGGNISSLLGSGIDIFSFSYITMRYGLSEKIATPTSVIIMGINSIMGFITHIYIVGDFGEIEFNYWLVSIPVVIIGAPLGVYFINQRTRGFISKFLYIVIIVQFIGAFLIIKPIDELLYFSGIIFLFGFFFFLSFIKLRKKTF